MARFKSFLKDVTLNWLLENINPSSRYLALTEILGESEEEPMAKKVRALINDYPPVLKILLKQKDDGSWANPDYPYLPKYKSTYWQIMIFSQLGLSIDNDKVRKACELVFKFQHEEGGFTIFSERGAMTEYLWKKGRLETKGKNIATFEEWSKQIIRENELTCLTGNLVAAMLKLGYREDERIKRAANWLVSVQNKDGGWLCPYWRAHIKDKHSCFVGTITPLDAFSEIPEEKRPEGVKQCIHKGVNFLLMHHLYKADRHSFQIINPDWLNFNFPMFWYDILRGLLVLTKLGFGKDVRIKDSLNILLKKQTEDGRWCLDKTPSGRMYTSFGRKGDPSKLVTINALKVLKRLYE